MKPIRNSGFTLIELLVVIALISLLSSVVMASLSYARNKAKVQRARTDMTTFVQVVGFAQGESGKTLIKMGIDGGVDTPTCAECYPECFSPNNLKNVPDTNNCYLDWVRLINGVKMNAGTLGDNLSGMKRDPWGSPYLVDQNQGEGGDCTNTQHDIFRSVGPDGIRATSDDINFTTSMPFAANCP